MIVISGTNRPGSSTRRVATHVVELLSQGGACQLLDLAELKPEIFAPASYGEKPTWFIEKFQRAIDTAQGIVVVTPEYNGSFPGVLKYFIDMLKFPESLKGIPCAFIGIAAGQFGAVRAVEQLEMIFNYRSAHLFGERLFVPAIHQHLKDDNSLGEHEERLVKMLTNFARFVSSHGPR